MKHQPHLMMKLRNRAAAFLFAVVLMTASLNALSRPAHKDIQLVYGVSITLETVYTRDIETVFGQISPEDILPKVLTGFGPIPAVVGTTGHEGTWGEPGAFRIVLLADGSTTKEQLIQFKQPEYFSYDVWDFNNPIIKTLADRGAKGEWRFTTVEGGTKVQWTYTFYTSNPLSKAALYLMVDLFWRGYMQVCLENFHEIIE